MIRSNHMKSFLESLPDDPKFVFEEFIQIQSWWSGIISVTSFGALQYHCIELWGHARNQNSFYSPAHCLWPTDEIRSAPSWGAWIIAPLISNASLRLKITSAATSAQERNVLHEKNVALIAIARALSFILALVCNNSEETITRSFARCSCAILTSLGTRFRVELTSVTLRKRGTVYMHHKVVSDKERDWWLTWSSKFRTSSKGMRRIFILSSDAALLKRCPKDFSFKCDCSDVLLNHLVTQLFDVLGAKSVGVPELVVWPGIQNSKGPIDLIPI